MFLNCFCRREKQALHFLQAKHTLRIQGCAHPRPSGWDMLLARCQPWGGEEHSARQSEYVHVRNRPRGMKTFRKTLKCLHLVPHTRK